MTAAELFIDRLASNAFDSDSGYYADVVAPAYDAWMPPGTVFADDRIHLETLRRAGGVGLELGVGTGRFLLAALAEGLHVEGIDLSADMLARCQAHLDARGLQAVLHVGDMAPLRLGRTYQAIVATAGSFSLVADPHAAAAALQSYHDHLAPGGALTLTMFTAGPSATTGFAWRLRRTGTADDTGLTYVVHEATGDDIEPQTILTYNRLEVYDRAGALQSTHLRKLRLRWWHQDELADAVRTAGLEVTRMLGDDDDWVLVARRPE